MVDIVERWEEFYTNLYPHGQRILDIHFANAPSPRFGSTPRLPDVVDANISVNWQLEAEITPEYISSVWVVLDMSLSSVEVQLPAGETYNDGYELVYLDGDYPKSGTDVKVDIDLSGVSSRFIQTRESSRIKNFVSFEITVDMNDSHDPKKWEWFLTDLEHES
tara:strand:+ start:4021 stop:4509 length:489 start_codon:yes stop_codon:yes gene_type:complete